MSSFSPSASAPSSSTVPPTSSSAASTPVHEPPWSGWIETTGDALIILEAARRGLIPRVTRRLVDAERKMITSGSVFVFDEEESGIKRWTDGLFWSASRILGNFLLYRETDKRGAGHKVSRSDTAVEDTQLDGSRSGDTHSLSRPRSETSRLGIDRQRERSLVGSLTNNEKFKHGGMVKKTFSLTINGVAQHLISYYKIEDIEEGRLRPPSSYPELASLDISAEFLDKTHFRLPPRVEIGFDGVPRYRGDADDVEPSPHVISAAMGSTPLLSEPLDVSAALSKRVKRFDPYVQPAKVKRRSKGTRSQPTSPATETPGPFSPDNTYALDTSGAYGHQREVQTPHQYSPAAYAIPNTQYNYQIGYATQMPLPTPQPVMLPPPVYQTALPTSAPSGVMPHGSSTTVLPSPQSQQPLLHHPAYSPPSLDAQYYSYYQQGYGWSNALPTYSQAQAQPSLPQLLSSPSSNMSEKSDGSDMQMRSQGSFEMALSPIL